MLKYQPGKLLQISFSKDNNKTDNNGILNQLRRIKKGNIINNDNDGIYK